MMASLDENVGLLVTALREKGMLENSIIVFTTDNGGPSIGEFPNYSSNFPFRGVKETLWEGGIRGAAFIWSPLLKSSGRVSNQLMHISDWLPTLYSVAGGNTDRLWPIDGVDMWSALSLNQPSPRKVILHNIDSLEGGYSALRLLDWKIVIGQTGGGKYDGYYGQINATDTIPYNWDAVWNSEAGRAVGLPNRDPARTRDYATIVCDRRRQAITTCQPLRAPCLFNIKDDPCEYNNLALAEPSALQRAWTLLQRYRKSVVPPGNIPIDPAANPRFWNGTWVDWLDFPLTSRFNRLRSSVVSFIREIQPSLQGF